MTEYIMEKIGPTTRYTWHLCHDEVGEVVEVPDVHKTVQVLGDLADASVSIEGSLKSKTDIESDDDYFPLKDMQGNEIVFTYPNGESVSEMTVLFRPRISGGTDKKTTIILLTRG